MQAPKSLKQCCQSGEWLERVCSHNNTSKRSSLAAHQEKDGVLDSAFDLQMHASKCRSILEGIVITDTTYFSNEVC